jgi:hypothetical protein
VNSHRFGIDVPGDQVGQQCRCRRSHLGGLDDDAVACGDGADKRGERELDRIVPGADDQHDTERLVLDPAPCGKLVEREARSPRTHPLPEVLAGMRDLSEGRHDVGDPGFRRRTAEVVRERAGDVGFMLVQQPLEPVQLGQPPLDRASAPARVHGAQCRDEIGDVFGSHDVEHGTAVTVGRTFVTDDSPAHQLPDLR